MAKWPTDLNNKWLLSEPLSPRPPESNEKIGIMQTLVPQKIQLFTSPKKPRVFDAQPEKWNPSATIKTQNSELPNFNKNTINTRQQRRNPIPSYDLRERIAGIPDQDNRKISKDSIFTHSPIKRPDFDNKRRESCHLTGGGSRSAPQSLWVRSTFKSIFAAYSHTNSYQKHQRRNNKAHIHIASTEREREREDLCRHGCSSELPFDLEKREEKAPLIQARTAGARRDGEKARVVVSM